MTNKKASFWDLVKLVLGVLTAVMTFLGVLALVKKWRQRKEDNY